MPLRVGTRGSALALAQATAVAELLRGAGQEVELVTIRTSGDAPGPVTEDKARFVKELEEALLADEVDLAVHSAKDVPAQLPGGLAIAGVPERADPRDALCGAASLDELAEGAVVGTSSLRRRAQLLAARPDLEVRDLRGNVDTRLRKLGEGEYDALLLAAAGLDRLGRGSEGAPLDEEAITPASGQGCLVLETRGDDAGARELAAGLTDRAALTELTAERVLVAALEATCNTPVGARARMEDGILRLDAFAGLPDGSAWVRDSLEGDPADPAALGRSVAQRMLAAGAGEVLTAAESRSS